MFFSKEVTPYLKKLLSGLSPEQRPFTNNPNLRNARQNEGDVLRAYCNKIGYTERYESTGNFKINQYCFRGYFYPRALKTFNDQTALAMMGWGAYLSQYQRRTDQEKKELWDELEPSVQVFTQQHTNTPMEYEYLVRENKALSDRVKKIEEGLFKQIFDI